MAKIQKLSDKRLGEVEKKEEEAVKEAVGETSKADTETKVDEAKRSEKKKKRVKKFRKNEDGEEWGEGQQKKGIMAAFLIKNPDSCTADNRNL